jgi:glycosyltransferase involved in cell wall biosynthesis
VPGGVVLAGPVPPWRSGIADQTVRLARALARIGFEPAVFTFRRMYPGVLFRGAADRGPGAFPPDLGDVRPVLDGVNPLSFASAAREIAALRPALLVLPWWTAFWAPHDALLLSELARRSPETVKLLLCHNLSDHEGGRLRLALSRAVFRRADRFIVQNRRSEGEIARAFPGRPVTFVPHPAEPPTALADRPSARTRLGIPAETPLFLFTGILRPYKGWDVLLRAFPRVTAAFPEARLVLAGEPWGDARRLGREDAPRNVRLELRYLPSEERGLWLSAADAVVCPYRHATGSGIAADAFAHGRPVIGTRVDGLVDVVEDGVNGLLVPPEDPAALADAMNRFLARGLGARLGEGAARTGLNLSPERHARAVLAAAGLVP